MLWCWEKGRETAVDSARTRQSLVAETRRREIEALSDSLIARGFYIIGPPSMATAATSKLAIKPHDRRVSIAARELLITPAVSITPVVVALVEEVCTADRSRATSRSSQGGAVSPN